MHSGVLLFVQNQNTKSHFVLKETARTELYFH